MKRRLLPFCLVFAVFAAAPENKLSSYLRVEADHAGTAEAGLEAVVAWLKTLS